MRKLVLCASILVASSAHAQSAYDNTARIHIASPTNVTLEMRDDSNRWGEVCSGSCDRVLPAGALYRITGAGVTTSRKFALRGGEANVWIDVKPASSTVHTFGMVSLVLGSIGMPLALNLMVWMALEYGCSDCAGGFADTTGLNIGWTILGLSALAMVVGTIAVTSSRTQVFTGLAEPSVASFVRRPEFEKRALGGPPALGVPLFSTTF